MATGPEHYAQAEHLLRGNYAPIGSRGSDEPTAYDGNPGPEKVAMAQVHATLALAAATVDVAMTWDGAIRNEDEWREVTKP